MAVVNGRAAELPDLNAAVQSRNTPQVNHGRIRTAMGTVTITNGDSSGSVFEVARVPSNARILKASAIHHSAITGLTDTDLGTANDADCLVDGQSLASAGTKDGASAIALANAGKKLYELDGQASDPSEEMSINLTLNANAGADGTVVVDLQYVTD